MSLTESQQAMLEKFYENEFSRTAQEVLDKGFSVFPMAPDSSMGSYYSVRENTRIKFTDSGGDLTDPVSLLQAIAGQQTDSNKAIIMTLVRSILELSSEFDQGVEQDAEVSPLIYVMF